MPRLSILSLLLVLFAALAVADDPVETVDAQLVAVGTLTPDCSVDSTLQWLDRAGEVFTRIASGGVPSLPPSAVAAVETLASAVVAVPAHMADYRVLAKVVEMVPSLWTAGFFYASPSTWKPVLSVVVEPLPALCKPAPSRYESLVNATSLVVRFTKDNVFFNGEDSGAAIPSASHRDYVVWLAQIVASVSTVDGFSLTARQLRDYMNTIPSKKDGMDTSVAFPVYVDTATYEASDATALREFLTTPQTSTATSR